MKSFSIDQDNNITAFASSKDAEASGESFHSQADLDKLAAHWPISRLVETWNGIPGCTRIKKFTNRKTAVARIWKAIQTLDGGVGAPAAHVAPDKTPARKLATPPPKRTRPGQKGSPGKQNETGKAARKPEVKTPLVREGSKTAHVLALLQRSQGATLQQIMHATGWQAHSVRGFLSGTLGKKMGLTVASIKEQSGERRYSVKS